MPKKQVRFELYTYGEYSHWEKERKTLPKILKITTRIEAGNGTEFGYILKIKKGKGEKLTYQIDHPPFKDKEGTVIPPFTGEHYIQSNDYLFFLGDAIQEPVADKLGAWRLTTWYKGEKVAEKIFEIVPGKRVS